ncbi:MAG: low specificity L-threonine aldolase [Myxococcota bacterium]
MTSRTFASDNNAGVHPEILDAITRANTGHARAYGDDPLTEQAVRTIRRHLGEKAEVFFVFNGTAANVLGLQALTQPHHAIICADGAHIQVDECGAPERFTGCKLLPVATVDGKLTVADVLSQVRGVGDQHHVQPRVVSISQSTELGTVYTPSEIRALADAAHAHGMFLHMDGARISNAAASLSCGLRETTVDAGVDVLSLGGTKIGLLAGEAVVLLRPELATDFKYVRKQAMQLCSKMRFVAAQFEALLGGDLWLRNARHANAMARLLEKQVRDVPGVRITRPVQANAVFAILPAQAIPKLQDACFFYVWNERTHEVRWMTSFDTTEDDVNRFAEALRRVLA